MTKNIFSILEKIDNHGTDHLSLLELITAKQQIEAQAPYATELIEHIQNLIDNMTEQDTFRIT